MGHVFCLGILFGNQIHIYLHIKSQKIHFSEMYHENVSLATFWPYGPRPIMALHFMHMRIA